MLLLSLRENGRVRRVEIRCHNIHLNPVGPKAHLRHIRRNVFPDALRRPLDRKASPLSRFWGLDRDFGCGANVISFSPTALTLDIRDLALDLRTLDSNERSRVCVALDEEDICIRGVGTFFRL